MANEFGSGRATESLEVLECPDPSVSASVSAHATLEQQLMRLEQEEHTRTEDKNLREVQQEEICNQWEQMLSEQGLDDVDEDVDLNWYGDLDPDMDLPLDEVEVFDMAKPIYQVPELVITPPSEDNEWMPQRDWELPLAPPQSRHDLLDVLWTDAWRSEARGFAFRDNANYGLPRPEGTSSEYISPVSDRPGEEPPDDVLDDPLPDDGFGAYDAVEPLEEVECMDMLWQIWIYTAS